MSLAAPVTIKVAAERIANQLLPWAEPRGGVVRVVENLRQVIQEVAEMTTDNAPRVLICYNGEKPRGGFNKANTLQRVDRQWLVVVIRGKGFTALLDASKGVMDSVNVEAFADSMETVRDGLRCLLNVSEEFPVDYNGMEPLPNVAPGLVANAFLDAMVIKFSTANDLPKIVLTPEGAVTE